MTRLILNGIGAVDLDLEHHTLTPVSLQVSYRLLWMIRSSPRKAARRMTECEQVASEYAEDADPWFWDLPVPPDYEPCPCHVC